MVLESPTYVTATLEISTDDPTGRIAAGLAHTCAIAQNNTIWCWGDNSLSQLGSSAYNTIADSLSLVPVQTAALGGGRIAQRIVAGLNHTCVLATDGTVWCWGENGKGAVGDGSFTNQENPVQVILADTATKIAAGGSTTCAVLTNNSVQCWGRNNFGQVGIGSVLSSTIGTPTNVLLIPASFIVSDIEVGLTHVCAVSTVGGAWCWGEGTNGRLGDGTVSNHYEPTATSAFGSAAVSISAGGTHTCAVLANNTVTCFGRNNSGQLSQATSTTQNVVPTVVTPISGASSVSVGVSFTCVLLTGGTVSCFGINGDGQLGSGAISTNRVTPAIVTGLDGTVVDITTGSSHSCAVISTGEVRCWGKNDYGQLGLSLIHI